MSRLLIRGGSVLTLGAKTPNHHSADVLINGDVISDVGPGLRARDAEVVEAGNAIVMPGFVDTHRHPWLSLFRNTGASQDDVDPKLFEPEDIYAATLVGLLGAIEAGTTTVVDWASPLSDSLSVEAAQQAHADAGLRTVFAHSALPDTPSEGGRADGSLRTAAFASPDLTEANIDDVKASWATARLRGLRIHAHAGLNVGDAGVVSKLAVVGVLASDVTLVHCSHLSDDDLDAVAASLVSVSLAPSSEMASGLGPPPLQKFLDRKILPGLATDDERLSPGDMFSQMRAANSIQHAAYFELKLAGKAGLPNLLTTRDVIRYATLDAARTIGLGDVVGSLEPGKRADLIILRTDRPNIYPINDPIGAVVWGVDSSNLDSVVVGGRALMRNGSLEADVDRARDLAIAARDRVLKAGGLLAGASPGEQP